MAQNKDFNRKEDAHRKIQLGGLVIKAGLADQDAAVILGALVSAAEAIVGSDGKQAIAEFRALGQLAFRAQIDPLPGPAPLSNRHG